MSNLLKNRPVLLLSRGIVLCSKTLFQRVTSLRRDSSLLITPRDLTSTVGTLFRYWREVRRGRSGGQTRVPVGRWSESGDFWGHRKSNQKGRFVEVDGASFVQKFPNPDRKLEENVRNFGS